MATDQGRRLDLHLVLSCCSRVSVIALDLTVSLGERPCTKAYATVTYRCQSDQTLEPPDQIVTKLVDFVWAVSA